MTAKKLSPGQLSVKTREAISPRTIFRWLAGETEPGIGALRVVCPALGVTSDWLLAIDDTHTI